MPPTRLRRQVGMVFRDPAVSPGSVHDNLLVAEPEADVDTCVEVLGRVGLDSIFLDRRADDLSGGEAQRICLAGRCSARRWC